MRPCLLLAMAVLATTSASEQDRTQKPLSATEVFKRASPAVVTIETPTGLGSGVIVDEAGVVATNLHVVRGDAKASVRLANGDAYDDVTVVDVDARKDLVLLKIKGFRLPTAQLGDSDLVAVGHAVYTIGSPRGLELTLSEGIISSLRDSGDGYRVIQTSAAISSGSSGGGLFDDQARLIGLTTFKVKGGENLNFVMPINYIRGMFSTTTRWTLAEMNARLDPSPMPARTTDPATSTVAAVESPPPAPNDVPRFAERYNNSDGSVATIVQVGGVVKIAFTTVDGLNYGYSQLTWNPNRRVFEGGGTIKTACEGRDNRVFDVPVQHELWFLTSNVLKSRWTKPVRMDCRRGIPEQYTAGESLWYERTRKH